jgi:hypothetical protein
MSSSTYFPKISIEELFGRVWHYGYIHRTDWQGLQSALSESIANQDEQAAIQRLRHAVNRGWLKIID